LMILLANFLNNPNPFVFYPPLSSKKKHNCFKYNSFWLTHKTYWTKKLMEDKMSWTMPRHILYNWVLYPHVCILLILWTLVNIFSICIKLRFWPFHRRFSSTLPVWPVRDCGATFLSTETKDWCGWWTSHTTKTLFGYTACCPFVHYFLINLLMFMPNLIPQQLSW